MYSMYPHCSMKSAITSYLAVSLYVLFSVLSAHSSRSVNMNDEMIILADILMSVVSGPFSVSLSLITCTLELHLTFIDTF